MSYRKIIPAFIIILLCGAYSASAQNRAQQIRSEIYIMESILDQLLQASRDNVFRGKNIKGLYLEDYGLLFSVNLERNNFSGAIIEFKKYQEKVREYEEMARAQIEAAAKDKKPMLLYGFGAREDSLEFQQRIEKLNKKIQTFLGRYVDVNNHLLPNDHVGVLVFFENGWNRRARGRFYQLKRKTIEDFRGDRISDRQFAQQISQHSVGDESDREEITIMGRVLKSTLSGKRVYNLHPTSGVNSFYISGLGVMFTLGDISFYDNLAFEDFGVVVPIPTEEMDPQIFVAGALKRKKEKEEKYRGKLSEYKERIVQCIGNYGPTLRFLPEDQSIFVLIGFQGGFVESRAANVMIRLKKTDIMQYSQKKLDTKGLIKRAHVEEY